MARSAAYRKYQLTFNNPAEHGFSHDIIKSTLESFSGCVYWCMCDELGEQKTPHTHLYVAFKNPVEFITIQQRFHGAHIENAKGSHRENRDYILKDGKWRDDAKHETNISSTFEEAGDLPPESDKRAKYSERLLELIESGASNAEILRECPAALNHLRNIDFARQELLSEEHKNNRRDITATYIWGKTGVGKTRHVMDTHGYANVFQVTNYKKNPFDGYRGQPVILFDEFRSDLDAKDMLKYMDGYPLLLPCRYSDKVACYNTVYVVSNIPIEQQYPQIQRDEPQTWEAFLRRFEKGGIYELLPDDGELPF